MDLELVLKNSLKELGLDFNTSDIEVMPPKDKKFGDYTTNIAMKLAKKNNSNPPQLAKSIKEELEKSEYIERVDIAGPGFLNLTMNKVSNAFVIKDILQNKNFGKGEKKDKRINLEFVSANPTGPLHIGHIRWAAVGSILHNLLTFAGYDVKSEYYFNDNGVQIDKFAKSLYFSKTKEQFDSNTKQEDLYQGEYIDEIASKIDSTNYKKLKTIGVEMMMNKIKEELKEFKTNFDIWFNESSLYPDEVKNTIELLRDKGYIYESEGATFFASEKLGDTKDRVIIKSDGNMAYFASDMAYYKNKRERNFDTCIMMLGADHHGYIGRLEALSKSLGDNPRDNLHILIGQLVNIKSSKNNGEVERLSKRRGNMIFMSDIIDLIGVDAARYSLGRANINRQITLDIDELTKMTNDNPVFYVKYVHARCCSVNSKLKTLGINFGLENTDDIDLSLLEHKTESDLLVHLQQFPRVIQEATQNFEQYKVCGYIEELATKYHRWYNECPILPKEKELFDKKHKSRLALNESVRIIVKKVLEEIIGIEAPERM